MATTFPTTLDSYSTITNPSTIVPADRVNDIADAVEALETKVGVNTSANNATIDYKLTNAASVDPGHKHNATSVNVDTDAFANNLTVADDTVQKALETLDGLVIVSEDWQSIDSTATYAAASDPLFQVYLSGDQTAVVQEGQRVQCTNNSATFYGIIHLVDAYDGGNDRTPIWIYGGTDYNLVNSAITNFKISKLKAPFGFPLSPYKWTMDLSVNGTDVATPGSNTYNLINNFDYKIGEWYYSFTTSIKLTESGATGLYFTGYAYAAQTTGGTPTSMINTIDNQKFGPVNTTNNNLTYFFADSGIFGTSINSTGGVYLYSGSASGIDTVRVQLTTLLLTSAYL